MISNSELLIRLGLACVIGGVIGLERENLNRPAGFRTHILVCVGSSLITVISIYGFQSGDPARLAAQVVSGIGFLGAGTIIREGGAITGLTTAASLWAVAGIGLALGAGMIFPALVTTCFILLTLVVFWRIESVFLSRRKYRFLNLTISDQPGQIGKIGTILSSNNVRIKNIQLKRVDDKHLSVKLFIKLSTATCTDGILENLEELDGVYSVDFD